ncbi:MAG: tetratricopeptide repeat protein [Acidobacteria bacterium]|nr:tetratricopeptide repeat protein [Acidobacteriota bacterium]
MWVVLSILGVLSLLAITLFIVYQEKWVQFKISWHMSFNRTDRALPLVKAQFERLQRKKGAGHLDTEVARYVLGEIEFENGLPKQGKQRVTEAAAWFATQPDQRDAIFAVHLMNLALAQRMAGDLEGAAANLRRTLAVQRMVSKVNDGQFGQTLSNLGVVLEEGQRPHEALEVYEEALSIRQAAHGEQSIEVARTRVNQACALIALENWGEAERCLRAALPVLQSYPGMQDLGQAYDTYGELLEKQKRDAEAEPMREASIQSLRQALGDKHPEVAKQFERKAALLGRLGHNMERDFHARKAAEIREALKCSLA